MESLLTKYIEEINQFKEDMEKKYGAKNVQLKIDSSYTWCGEALDARVSQGDFMQIFEETEPVIRYYHPPQEPVTVLKVNFMVQTLFTSKYSREVYVSTEGYYIEVPSRAIKTPAFQSIEELIRYMMEEHGSSYFDVDEDEQEETAILELSVTAEDDII